MSELLTRWHRLSKKVQWLSAIGFLVAVSAIFGAASNQGTSSPTSTSSATADPVTQLVDVAEDSFDSETPGQENAREQAESYLNSMAFSRKGLIEQLEYEDYSTADATYAVDNVVVDWSEQAALKAQSYLDSQSFSRSGLMDQLLYEGFSQSQASYGVSAAY